jgi:hypothetical protein
MGSKSSYDFLVDGRVKIDVKAANPYPHNGTLRWEFNIHRHGKNFSPDCYVFRFEGIPFVKRGIFALVEGPISQKVYAVSMRDLVNGFAARTEAFKRFVKTGEISQLPSGNVRLGA